MKKTKFFNNLERRWYLVDAKNKVLGRLSTRIAMLLQGKHKATYSPNFLCGDYVVVVNAKYIRVSGKKAEQKVYDRYSGYPGGIKEISFKKLREKNPSRLLYLAVRGMVPKSRLGKRMIRLLKVYPEEKHKHQAQNPQKLEV